MDSYEGKVMLRWLYVQIGFLSFFAAAAQAATGFLDTPDACLSVKEIRGTSVYLQPVGKCEGKPGRAYVEAKPGEHRELFVDGRPVGRVQVKALDVSDVSGVLDRADRVGKSISIPDNPHVVEMQKAAEQARQHYESAAFQHKLQQEMNRIRTDTVGDQYASYYNDAVTEAGEGALGGDERLYIFVSSSMPLHVVRTYVADIAKLKDRRVSVVLRGFVDGMEKIVPTTNYIMNVIKKKSTCEIAAGIKCDVHAVGPMVDPLLFRKYEVTSVPAFVYVKGIKPHNPGMSEGDGENLADAGSYIKVSGDVSLRHVLQKFSESSGAGNLAVMASRLR